jgi:hypothetical protein
MSIQDDVKVLGRTRARDLNAVALRKRVDTAIEALKVRDDVEAEALLLVMEVCAYLLEKDSTAQT